MSNRDRIIETSRKLMNDQGAQAIGTTQISDALNISPGNLYYHFKNKEEIIRAIFEGLDQEFRLFMTEDIQRPIQVARFSSFYKRSLEVQWKYRFFFNGVLHLVRRDKLLASQFRNLQNWGILNLENIARQLNEDGNMVNPRGKNGYKSIATNMWLVWTNWIRFVQISDDAQRFQEKDRALGAVQLFDIMAPYLEPKFERAVRKNLSKGV